MCRSHKVGLHDHQNTLVVLELLAFKRYVIALLRKSSLSTTVVRTNFTGGVEVSKRCPYCKEHSRPKLINYCILHGQVIRALFVAARK